jgi:hypothetical protein
MHFSQVAALFTAVIAVGRARTAGAVAPKLANVSVEPDPSGTPPDAVPSGPGVLEGDRQSLFAALDQMRPELGQYYLGALYALDDHRNPEHLSHAAHSVRELIEKLPGAVGVGYRENQTSLKHKVRGMHGRWVSARQNSAANALPDGWTGRIDNHLYRYLTASGRFFDWFDEHHPTRAAETASLLRQLNMNDTALASTEVEIVQVKTWQGIRDYFLGVAHHRRADVDDFLDRFSEFERFLLSLLTPRTFESFDALDEILREAEGS